jgi:hypothetical protein
VSLKELLIRLRVAKSIHRKCGYLYFLNANRCIDCSFWKAVLYLSSPYLETVEEEGKIKSELALLALHASASEGPSAVSLIRLLCATRVVGHSRSKKNK